jgi:hypothetical protein
LEMVYDGLLFRGISIFASLVRRGAREL